MKKLAIAFALVGLALSVTAADYTVTLSAGEEAVLNKVRLHLNRQTCDRLVLGANCTQPQVNLLTCERLGLPTTCLVDNPALEPLGVIYGTSAAQVSALIKKLAVDAVQTLKAQRDNSAEADLWNTIRNGSQAQKDAACAAVGLPAGCYAP